MVPILRLSSRKNSNILDIVFNMEIGLWLQGSLISLPDFGIVIIVAIFYNYGKYSRWMHPLKMRVSCTMIFLSLCFSTLLVMQHGPGAIFLGDLQILLQILLGKKD